MKIFKVEYTVKANVIGTRGWDEIGPDCLKVSARSAQRAIEAAHKHALQTIEFKSNEDGKKKKERFKDFELLGVTLVAEADISG